MSFFRNIFQAESPVSSRRIIAVWVAFILVSFVVYRGVNQDNALSFLHALLAFLGVILGLTTFQNVKTKMEGKNGTINPDPKDPPKDKPE